MDIISALGEWIMCICLVLPGMIFWIITYILAPVASRKQGKYVSGFPAVGGLLIGAGFLLSPCKILALFGFIDWKIFFLFKEIYVSAVSQRERKKRPFPDIIDDQRVLKYTKYKPVYDTCKSEENGTLRVHYISCYAIVKGEDCFRLISFDAFMKELKGELFHSLEECMSAAPEKVKWIDKQK